MVDEQINDNFGKVLNTMETKIYEMEKELSYFHDERKRIENWPSGNTSPESTPCKLATKADIESILNQLRRLQCENQNMTNDLNEWKLAYDTKANECEMNRDKYLHAEQIAEDYRKQLEKLDKDTSRDQGVVNAAGLQMFNESFKEQLDEVEHLKFVFETKQLEHQDTQAKLRLAERTIDALSSDLEACIIKCELLQNDVDVERDRNIKLEQEGQNSLKEITECKTKYDKLNKENESLLTSLERMTIIEERLERKTKEMFEWEQHLEELKEDNVRHVRRIKDRADAQKRAFQAQIAGLEKELVQLRANLNTAFKERDEMRQRMQNRFSKLELSFNDAERKILSIKSQVDILQMSYSSIFEGLIDSEDDDNIEEIQSLRNF